MNNDVLISVIIACFNQAHYLEETIQSILAQSHQHYEIIVVDDGSRDNTTEVASRYAQVRVIRQQNSGTSSARNAGLRESTGEYVVFLDADDRLLPNALESGATCLQTLPDCALVFGFCEVIDQDGRPSLTLPHPPVEENYYPAFLKRNYIWTPGAAMFRRSVFATHKAFDESFVEGCEDWELYLRVAKDSRVYCHGEVVIQYRRHSRSMSANDVRMSRAANRLFRKQLKAVKGDRELELLCRNKITPFYRLVLLKPPLNQVTIAIKFRTRLRSMLSRLRAVTKFVVGNRMKSRTDRY